MGRAGSSPGSTPDSAWATRSPTCSGASACGAMQSPKQVTETGFPGGVTYACSGVGLSEQGAARQGAHPARELLPSQPRPPLFPGTGASPGVGHRTSLVSTPRGLSTTQVKLVCRCWLSKELKCRSRRRANPEPCSSSLWTQRAPISAHSRQADPEALPQPGLPRCHCPQAPCPHTHCTVPSRTAPSGCRLSTKKPFSSQ